MSRRSAIPLAVTLILCSTPFAGGQALPIAEPESVGVSSKKLEELSGFMQSLVDEDRIAGGVTMMARHGRLVHARAVGMADRDAKSRMQVNTIFRIASMTKPIVSVAVMMLHDEGIIGLDDPIDQHLAEFKNPHVLVDAASLRTAKSKSPTIRQLLSHTGGFTYPGTESVSALYRVAGIPVGMYQIDDTLARGMERLGRLPLAFHPGEKWEYGMNTDVLGRLVEVKSGRNLNEFLRERILGPLNMHDTHFFLPQEKLERLAALYRINEAGELVRLREGTTQFFGGVTPISADYPYRGPQTYFSPSGGLCSTASDYLRFCQMILNRGELDGTRLLRPETVELMTHNQIGALAAADWHGTKFGLGFAVVDMTEDVHPQEVGTCAWSGFFTTSFCIAPKGDWIVVAMTQLFFESDLSIPWAKRFRRIAAEAVIPTACGKTEKLDTSDTR